MAGHYLLKDSPVTLTIMILNHHVKLSRRLITEAIVKINCSQYCAPSSCPSFQTLINLEFLHLNKITFLLNLHEVNVTFSAFFQHYVMTF